MLRVRPKYHRMNALRSALEFLCYANNGNSV